MRPPGLLCLIFGSTRSLPHFGLRHVAGLCNCNMHFVTSFLLIFLSCSFEARLLEVQILSALLLPANLLLCQCIPIVVSVFSSVKSSAPLQGGIDEIGP